MHRVKVYKDAPSSHVGLNYSFIGNQKQKLRMLFCVGLCVVWVLLIFTLPVFAAKFEPPDGKTIVVIGQEKDEIALYKNAMGGQSASGYMLYTSVSGMQGLTQAWRGTGCGDSGTHDLQDWVNNYPNSVVQIGLFIEPIASINNGSSDNKIRSIANILRNTRKPVFLRIGYEFDGPWNQVEPAPYKTAWQRIVNIFRGVNVGGQAITPVNNVAFVWHSAAYYTYNGYPISDWYPGDSFVDWIAVSWFGWGSDSDNNVAANAREVVKTFAQNHSKPLMIGEAAPRIYFHPKKINAWNEWFLKVFNWIESNNVKAFSYINQNWLRQGMWDPVCGGGDDWGNTRVQISGSRVIRLWRNKLTEPRYLNASPTLYSQIGFTPND